MAGAHLREILGEWGGPTHLRFVQDRLYLVEQRPLSSRYGRGRHFSRSRCGRRVFVLTPEGRVLQVYSMQEGRNDLEVVSIEPFGRKLLIVRQVERGINHPLHASVARGI